MCVAQLIEQMEIDISQVGGEVSSTVESHNPSPGTHALVRSQVRGQLPREAFSLSKDSRAYLELPWEQVPKSSSKGPVGTSQAISATRREISVLLKDG